MLAIACEALTSHRRLEIRYDGMIRVVEVHAVGVTKDGNAIMRVWQVRGGSASGETTGWKLMRFDSIQSAKIISEKSEAPRDGYRKNDTAMRQIKCQI